ncbi:MAG: glycosyltransferase [Gemmatimonadota bacterium]
MHIALLYHQRIPVDRYGGTERVVVWHARGLVELGHRVTLIAPPGCKVPNVDYIAVDGRAVRQWDFDIRPHLPPGIDLIHAHKLFHPIEVPSVWTMHGVRTSQQTYPDGMICLSADHARRMGCRTFVYNGLDPDEFRFEPRKAGFDLFLGRLRTMKGWRWAIEGAHRADRDLVVAGGWRPSLRRGLRFAGEVGGEEKRNLLAGAACLWMPALWDEPFGLTLIEAMASGTPILGTTRGALPEIVTPDVGALGDTLEELVALRPTVDRIDPAACRARLEAGFTHRTMAERYLAVYRHRLATGTLPTDLRFEP